MALGRPVDIAINHDPDAILMHKTNHPRTLHLTEDIFRVDLKKYVKGQHVALMWASPDCTSHSKAKGGKPRERGLRILPWAVYKKYLEDRSTRHINSAADALEEKYRDDRIVLQFIWYQKTSWSAVILQIGEWS